MTFLSIDHIYDVLEEKYTFQLILGQSVNVLGPHSTRFKGANEEHVCNQLLICCWVSVH